MRRWFATELETVATWWRVIRRDGVTLGFTSHDRDLWFDGVSHLAAPGMLPSAVHLTASTDPDSAEMQGALDHKAITAADLDAGRYDGARVRMGLVDWESGEAHQLFLGSIGTVGQDGTAYTADLRSAKADLVNELVPRTAPTCRAEFCGPGCGLSAARFTHAATVAEVEAELGRLRLAAPVSAEALCFGTLRWVDGLTAGREDRIAGCEDEWLAFDSPLPEIIAPGAQVTLREGCDHTLETCAARFANAVNFQGEPFLPGNDSLTRYASPAS